MDKNGLLSLIIPAYNEQENIELIYNTIDQVMQKENIPYEIVFIDDGSSDETYLKINSLSGEHGEVKGISFSRNFGKESAIFAGLEAAAGDCAVVMDCDLQHPVETVPSMYRLWQEGYEVVEGIKTYRGKESAAHGVLAGAFYKMMTKSAGVDMSQASDFKLLDRKAIDSILLMPERTPFFRALSSWVGFKSTRIGFEVNERRAGTSKWSFWKLTRYAIHNVTSFTSAPMQFVTIAGVLMLVFSLIIGIQSLYKYFAGEALEGFTTVILLLLIIGSVLTLGIGIIGHYISRIYEEIKGRPRYLITDRCGYDEKKPVYEKK